MEGNGSELVHREKLTASKFLNHRSMCIRYIYKIVNADEAIKSILQFTNYYFLL